jgi:hypothetical protein
MFSKSNFRQLMLALIVLASILTINHVANIYSKDLEELSLNHLAAEIDGAIIEELEIFNSGYSRVDMEFSNYCFGVSREYLFGYYKSKEINDENICDSKISSGVLRGQSVQCNPIRIDVNAEKWSPILPSYNSVEILSVEPFSKSILRKIRNIIAKTRVVGSDEIDVKLIECSNYWFLSARGYF